MNKTPNANVQLTFEQLQQIDASKKVLTNLEAEIVSANKTLKETRLESATAVKDKDYQQSLLETVSAQVKEKQDIASQLDTEILAKNSEKSQLLTDIEARIKSKLIMENDLKDREDKVSVRETAVTTLEQIVSEAHANLMESSKSFSDKVIRLRDLIDEF